MKIPFPIPAPVRAVLGNRLVQAALVLFVLGLLGVSVLWLRPAIQTWHQTETIRREGLPGQYLEKARELERIGDDNQAYVWYQTAIDRAVRPADRARAGRLMGEFLLKRARVQPSPFGAMARGYLESALVLENNPDEKLAINQRLIEIARLLGETRAVAEVSEQALALAGDDAEKGDLLMAQYDALLAIGTWDETHSALAKLEALDLPPDRQTARTFRRALYQERLLSDDAWFQRWLAAPGPRRHPVTARPDLLKDTLALFDGLAGSAPDLAEESLFRAARLCSAENLFEEARARIRTFFEQNYHAHEAEIILLLIRMARLEGNTRQTQTLISQLLRRYQWMDKAADELLAVVEQAEAVGHLAEAFEILDEFLKVTPAREGLARLAYKAGDMAARLKLYDRAMALLDRAEQAQPDDDLHVSILMAKANVALQRKDYGEAQRWLTLSLTRFPYDPRRGKALYQLVDVFRKSQAPLANILVVMSMAVDVAPNDPAALDVLMQLAKRYEELGLYTRAEEKYAKVALLRTVDSSGRGRPGDSVAVSEALLGSARCLVRTGDAVRADRILRGLTRNLSPGPLYNEAVYLWATLAIAQNQRAEAMRRLDLMDLARSPRDIRTRAQLERLLLEVADRGRDPETVVAFVASVKTLPADELEAYARRAYVVCFERLARENNIPAMQQFLDRVAGTVPSLPVAAWVMKLASTVLAEHGVPAFMACLDRNLSNLEAASADQVADVNALVAMAASIEKVKTRVDAFVR
jgi:tetratricopeptide (TPR) repeat protein